LNVLPIWVPPLRDIKDDLSVLAGHIIMRLNLDYGRQVERINDHAMEMLRGYQWPGNVRELQNVIGRAMINMKPAERTIGTVHLPLFECERNGQVIPGSPPDPVKHLGSVIAVAEKAAIEQALHEAKGNREQAAQLLGTAVRSLYYKIRKYKIKT
jgi:transcriptional regulator with PAS, ATPase and Fis domain